MNVSFVQKSFEKLLLQVPMEGTIGRKLGRELDSKCLCVLGGPKILAG